MADELKKQRIRSIIENGGYADREIDTSWIWKWVAAAAVVGMISHLMVELLM